MRELLVATTNRGKLREYARILRELPLRLLSVDDLPARPPEPPEDAETYAENAIAKAREYAKATGLPTVADDSGLEVAALDGAPGVWTKRYFGEEATDAERNAKLGSWRIVIPTTASSDRTMIWTTAKSTEVKRRRTVRPRRSKTSGAGGRADSAHVVTGLAIGRSSGRSDGSRFGASRLAQRW